jgi:hypothetical protein
MDASFCGPTVVAAMGFVAHTDAIIFDLRQNGGGQPAMVTLIASYLFDKPTHLIDIYNRKEDSTTQNWTLSYLPGPRLAKAPVFVLTSKRTFSGAEEFAFDFEESEARHDSRRDDRRRRASGVGAHGCRLLHGRRAVCKIARSSDEDELGRNRRGTGYESAGGRCSGNRGEAEKTTQSPPW